MKNTIKYMKKEIVVAVKGIIFFKGKVLIVKRNGLDSVGAGTWETPGGKIEFGENLEEALCREVKEETGIDITVERLLYAANFMSSATRQVIILSYLCQTKNDQVILSEEHTAYKWADRDKLMQCLPNSLQQDFERNGIYQIPYLEQN